MSATANVKVVLVDINPKMVAAWRETFEENPEVEVRQGSMLEEDVDAWVSPTNSAGSMDGGLDAIIKSHLGAQVETRLKSEIKSRFGAALPLGHATCIASARPKPRFLISTPTMVASSEDVGASLNTALACAAAFQAVRMQNVATPGSISSVALPGLGANTGRVPVEVCADLMWTAYNLFRTRDLADFQAVRAALEEELGDVSPMTPGGAKPAPKATPATGGSMPTKSALTAPSGKDAEVDFDDFD